jgi:AraC family transcriptional regulator, transcriptional activator of pobA
MIKKTIILSKIPILNPQLFLKDYFDHNQMEVDGFNVNAITTKEKSCFFLISAIETGKKYISFPKQSIKTNFYEIIFVTKGYNVVTDNLNEFTQIKNQIRFVSPGKITSVKELSDDVEGFYLLFDQVFIDTYYGTANLLNSFRFFDLDALSIFSLTDAQANFFTIIFDKIKADFTTNYENSKQIICQYLVSVLKECHLFYEKINIENQKLNSAERITQEFIRLVNKYYLSKRTLTEYADLLNITTKYLTKCVKQSSGETPMDFIQKMLVLEAKVLLKESNQSVAEIAYQLSFEDSTYFSRFFKQHTGVTPANFRNLK